MRTYDKYKDSGISWIGKVPEGWEKCRFKNIMNLITDASTSDNKIGLENIESGTGKYVQTDSKFEGNGVAFKPHDIVYGKLRPYLQKVWCADSEGNAVGDFFVFRKKCNSSSSFLKYVLISDNFTQFANGTTYGAKMPRVSSNAILDQETYIPPLPEQEAIANYLDKKTAEIDKIIAEREKKIELLNELKSSIISRAVTKGINPHAKMKDSGIDWIGKVPEDWERVRIKYGLSQSIAGVWGDEKKGDENDVVCYRMADFNYDKGILNLDNVTYRNILPQQLVGRMVKKGDLILEKSGGGDLYPVGRVVRVNSDQKATCSNFAHTIATNDNISSNFLYYYFFNLYSKGVSRLFFNQTTGIQNLKVGEYLSQDMYAPSKPEQEAIANYLDKKTDEIDRTISAIKNECNLYKEYKQSLISEVVTGKRKVID